MDTTVADRGVHAPTKAEREEFELKLKEATLKEEIVPVKRIGGKPVTWSPQNGSQNTFMKCELFEALYHGTRGPGKTDALIMAFAMHVGQGHGSAWRGIIFRQTYPQLADVQAKTEKWFRQMFPDAKFNRSKMLWEWPTGEVLLLRHMARPTDYWNYHGHEYPFIGWEELANWADDQCYKSMMACCRSSTKGVPRMIRANTNPYGVGHHWIKDRFKLHGEWWKTITILDATDQQGNVEPPRVAIHGHLKENKILLDADPNYRQTLAAAAANPEMAKAWQSGSWEIVTGGMFGDVWDPAVNIVAPFHIPYGWRIDRSFDWGSSAPFSVGWWAESDGSDIRLKDGKYRSTVRGDLFRIAEWYGWNGRPNKGLTMLAVDIAKGIVERQLAWGLHDRVKPGPADSAIFGVENGMSVGADMSKPVRIGDKMYKGIHWHAADKRPGSRRTGWEMVRKVMSQARPNKDGKPREHPGLFVFDTCDQFIRTVPALPRKENDMDDIDTNSEDHIGDEVRYRIRAATQRATSGRTTGMY